MWLRVLTGEAAGRIVEVRAPTFTVGRDRDCDLVLRDPSVAGRHAVFQERGDRVVLEDLGSEGGTFVATRRITSPTPVSGREELCFGETFVQLGRTRRDVQRRRPVALLGTILVLVGLAAVGFAVLIATTGSDGDGPAAGEQPLALTTQPATEAEQASPEATEEAATDSAVPAETAPAETTPAETAPAETAPAETLPFAGGNGVLFSDDFADPATGWEVFDEPAARAAYRDGRFVVEVRDASYYATSSSGRAFDEADVRVTVANPSLATDVGFGVLCRYRDEENFDLLAAGADGTAAILRREDGVLRVVTGGGSWAASEAVPVGARRYELRAECRADRLRLFVGGRRAASVTLPGSAGEVGLFVVGPAEIRFDDLVVAAPRG